MSISRIATSLQCAKYIHTNSIYHAILSTVFYSLYQEDNHYKKTLTLSLSLYTLAYIDAMVRVRWGS